MILSMYLFTVSLGPFPFTILWTKTPIWIVLFCESGTIFNFFNASEADDVFFAPSMDLAAKLAVFCSMLACVVEVPPQMMSNN